MWEVELWCGLCRFIPCPTIKHIHSMTAFHEGTTPSPPPPRTHHHPTPMHHPQLPFHTPCPKPSHNGSVSSFWLKPHPPPRISRTHHPTTTTSSYAPLHRIPTSPSATIPNSAPETEPQRPSFGFSMAYPKPSPVARSHFFLSYYIV